MPAYGSTTRIIKPVLWLVLILVVPLSFAKAQSQDRAEYRTQQLKQALSLTEEQTDRVRAIMETLDQQTKTAKTENKGNRHSVMKAVRARIADADREVESLLTPEQSKKFETFKKARRDEFRGWRKGKGSEYNF